MTGLFLLSTPEADAAETASRAPGSVAAADSAAAGRCLSRGEQRAHIAAKTVIPLAKAARTAHGRGDHLIHARLCERDGGLVYLLTVLARGGKVVRTTVDAGSGALVNAAH